MFAFMSFLFTSNVFASNTITVMNNASSGPGSLSAAVSQANMDNASDLIVFKSGVNSISLSSILAITSPMTIDGSSSTAPGGKVEITKYGFDVKPSANGTTLKNLYISTNNFVTGEGILLEGRYNSILKDVISGNFVGVDETGGYNIYSNNFIGTDITGTTVIGSVGNGYGLYMKGSGHDLFTGNVISGNHVLYTGDPTIKDPNDPGFVIYGAGVYIFNPNAGNNIFKNNHIGTDVTGTKVIENGSGILSYAGNNTITNNQVAGYHITVDDPYNPVFGRGIIMMPGADSNMISNNLFSAYINSNGQYVPLPMGNYGADDIDLKSNSSTVQHNVFLSIRCAVSIAGFAGSSVDNNNVVQNNLMGIDPYGNNNGGAAYGALIANSSSGDKILNNVIYSDNATIFGGSIVSTGGTNLLIQGNITAGGEKGISPLFGGNNKILGNAIYNTVGSDTADNGDYWANNLFSGNSLSINDHGSNAQYVNNLFINPVYAPYQLPFFSPPAAVSNVFIIHAKSTLLQNNVMIGAGAAPNMGPALAVDEGPSTGLQLVGNAISNYPIGVTFDQANSASFSKNIIVGLGKNSSNPSYAVQITGTGNTLSDNGSTFANATYGLSVDSSLNSVTLSNDLFLLNLYGIFDKSTSLHTIVLNNVSFLLNTYNKNY